MSENGMYSAHWKHIKTDYGEETYECSECGLTWALDDGNPQEYEMFYCPKCGSKMSSFIESMNVIRVAN